MGEGEQLFLGAISGRAASLAQGAQEIAIAICRHGCQQATFVLEVPIRRCLGYANGPSQCAQAKVFHAYFLQLLDSGIE